MSTLRVFSRLRSLDIFVSFEILRLLKTSLLLSAFDDMGAKYKPHAQSKNMAQVQVLSFVTTKLILTHLSICF